MRSEHNGGASLAAFLLAVSTMTLLMVSPVEGQVGDACVVTAFPGETGSCPATDSQGDALLCVSDQCQTCESDPIPITTRGDCSRLFADEDQIANCLRDCFGLYVCTSNADCRDNRPTCVIATGATEGECQLECEVSAFPDAAGSCPDIPVEEVFAGPQLCARIVESICLPCTRFQENFGITTAADCELFSGTDFGSQTADVVANCQRECFGFYACTTNADCPDTLPICNAGQCLAECGTNADCPADRPLCESGQCLAECGTNADCPADRPLCDAGQCLAECGTNADCPADRPICNAGQCEISVFSPLDGMGGGSSA